MEGGRSAYRVPPPEQRALVAWPADFGSRFTVFVDTEEEFEWRAPFSRDAHSTRAIAALPTAHRRFADREVPLTYLVDYPVATALEAVEVLRGLIADGRSAIGAQLHPWVNPPFDEELNGYNSFCGNLPKSLEAAKLATLTEMIAGSFGQRPLAFRAGRYGIGPETLGLLRAQGYRVDTSIRAFYDYGAEGGPDFRGVGDAAFRTGPDGAILELPFSTVFTGRMRGRGEPLYRALGRIPRARGVAARLGLLSRVSLTPEDMPLGDAIEAIQVAAGEGQRLLNLAFHSPSLEPGHTPYVRDAADLAAFWRWWDAVLDLLDRSGIRPAALGAVIAAADAACGAGAASATATAAGGL